MAMGEPCKVCEENWTLMKFCVAHSCRWKQRGTPKSCPVATARRALKLAESWAQAEYLDHDDMASFREELAALRAELGDD